MKKINFSFLVLILLVISIAFSFYFNEDSTGGAKNDYIHHEKIIFLFAENFKETFLKYGTDEVMARNSPIFYILMSFFIKIGISIETLKYANSIIIPFYIFAFIECMKIRYKSSKLNDNLLFSSIILLSPTIRSLVVWPYPFIWALLFFVLSIMFFLKFKESNDIKIKFKYSTLNVFSLAISAYITPNFAVFAIFYFIYFLKYFGNSKNLLFIILLNLLLAIPAIFYYIKTDFYLFKYTVETVDNYTKFNLTNKIIIISSLIFFYFSPFLNFKILGVILNNFFKQKTNLYILVVCFLIIFLFNFPSNLGFGGGIFFHISNKFLGNPLMLFFIFIFAVLIFKGHGMFNFNNLMILFCLLIYNAQASIYHKYFDPLIYFLILFLFEFNFKNIFKINNFLFYKMFIFYGCFWLISIYKKLIIY